MSKYQEIINLQSILSKHKIIILPTTKHPNFHSTENIWVEFIVDGYAVVLLVDDEFKDFQLKNPVLNLCLILRELETYAEEEDILKWANFKGLTVSNSEVVAYYKELSEHYRKIEAILGTIDGQISDFDFQLNAGSAQELRKISN